MESPPAAPGLVPAFTDAGEGITFKMLGTTMRLIATAAETAGRYAVLEQVTPVGWGPPRHIHSREDEIFYILEGTYEVHCGCCYRRPGRPRAAQREATSWCQRTEPGAEFVWFADVIGARLTI